MAPCKSCVEAGLWQLSRPATSKCLRPSGNSTGMATGMQVVEWEDEHGVQLPAVVRVNGGAAKVSLLRLVSFTGTRFLRSSSVDSKGGSSVEQRDDSAKGEDQKIAAPCIAATTGLTFPDAELADARNMFDIMEGRARDRLSLDDIDALLGMCKFSMADQLVAGFGSYLLPLAQAPSNDVRCCSLQRASMRHLCALLAAVALALQRIALDLLWFCCNALPLPTVAATSTLLF